MLRRNLKRAADLGYTFYVGPGDRVLLLRELRRPERLDHGGYFDLTPLDAGTDLRRETVLTLEELGIPVETRTTRSRRRSTRSTCATPTR